MIKQTSYLGIIPPVVRFTHQLVEWDGMVFFMALNWIFSIKPFEQEIGWLNIL